MSKHACKHQTHPVKKKEFHFNSNDLGFICADVSIVCSYKRKVA